MVPKCNRAASHRFDTCFFSGNVSSLPDQSQPKWWLVLAESDLFATGFAHYLYLYLYPTPYPLPSTPAPVLH